MISSCRYWISRAGVLGEQCAQWAQAAFDLRGSESLRSIMGLCGLIKDHSATAINVACALKAPTALEISGVWSANKTNRTSLLSPTTTHLSAICRPIRTLSTSSNPMNNTLTNAHSLRLSGLLQSLELRLQQAEANRLPYAQFLELRTLELLFQDESNVPMSAISA